MKATLWYHTLTTVDTSFPFPTSPTVLRCCWPSETKRIIAQDGVYVLLQFAASLVINTQHFLTIYLPKGSSPVTAILLVFEQDSRLPKMNCAVTAHRLSCAVRLAHTKKKKKHFHSSTTSFLSPLKVWAHQYMPPTVGDHHRLSSAEWRRWARPDTTSFGFKRGAHQSGRAVVAQRSSLSQVNSNTWRKTCTCTNFKSTIIYVLFCSGCYLEYTKLYTVFIPSFSQWLQGLDLSAPRRILRIHTNYGHSPVNQSQVTG